MFSETNDFRYIALAIGAHPLEPPKWAIEACIAERLAAERATSMASSVNHASRILDLAVALMAQHEADYFKSSFNIATRRSRSKWYSEYGARYKRMPLETALRQALLAVDPNPVDIAGAVENLVNAWKREQKEDALDDTLPTVHTLRGINPTKRINRVLNALEELSSDPDGPLSADPELLLWLAKREGLLSD